ncbi:hypothetical protein [uncultured Thermomonospora sp.]|uniref:hypothetical protein n=1 Tax=uncultured Thermomonospora sp. TaxID=671175 RepID=UPI00259BDC47|nr:hypothetical protein [uncultured Thermomonospora sp.]
MPAKRYQLTRYRKEALKPDFELVLDDGDPIVIKCPTVEEVLDLSEMTDARSQLQVLAKDNYDRLVEAIGGEPGGVINRIMEDIMEHFGLGKSSRSQS